MKSVVNSIDNPNFEGKVGNVREEESFIELLRSLAPIDHLVFSGVDKWIPCC